MRVLYYREVKINRSSGVANVAYNLPRALSKKVRITSFPEAAPNIGFATKSLNIFGRIMTKKFEIVHFNIPPSWTETSYLLFKFAEISNASTILNIHGIVQLEYGMYGYTKDDLNKYLFKIVRSCKIADKVVTYSQFMRNRIITWYRVNPEKIVVIPNGVNVSKFSESKGKLFLDGDPAILSLGHLSKGTDLLINAISAIQTELPKLKLHLVGGGDMESLKLLAKKKGVETRVVFHGSVSPEKTASYYKAADFFVFPSIHTPAGITILEAMASGTAVIASTLGGTQEILSNGVDGLLFNANDSNALPQAILALQQDSKLKKKLSQNALRTVKAYDWQNIAEKYMSLYRNLREKSCNRW